MSAGAADVDMAQKPADPAPEASPSGAPAAPSNGDVVDADVKAPPVAVDDEAPPKADAAASGEKTVMELDSDEELVPQAVFVVDVKDELKGEGIQAEDAEDPDDPERLEKETDPWPSLHPPADLTLSTARAKHAAKLRQDTEKAATTAIAHGDSARAIDAYTEAMRTCGSTAAMLANRAQLLLKVRRPCAAIRDATAAIQLNSALVKAYKVRGEAHRRLGHWRKAHRDISEAQALKFDSSLADMQKLVAAQLTKAEAAAHRRAAGLPPLAPARRRPVVQEAPKKLEQPGAKAMAAAYASPQVSENLPDMDKGQAVVLVGLQKAPFLNGRRGVVERKDPRPAAKGRWEVEVRLDGGVLEIKSLKRENIQTLNKADKVACKGWAAAEKRHKEERELREKAEEQQKYKACVEATLKKSTLTDQAKGLLRSLRPEEALSLLDRSNSLGVTDVSNFVVVQAKLALGMADEAEGEDGPAAKKAKTGEEQPQG